MAVRTRELLIEVAKRIFIEKGVENTTIADIANASDKGRRTIYTYFKSKYDIYHAVIERESEEMVSALREVATSVATAKEKLRRFMELRLTPAMNTTSPHSTLRSMLNMDFGRTTKARKKASEKEVEMLNSIIDQGISSGEFCPMRAERLRTVLYTLIRSIDLLSANDEMEQPTQMFSQSLATLISEAAINS